MIILDANVVSELMSAVPNPAVLAWAAGKSAVGLFLSAVAEAELFYGIEPLPAGRRRDDLRSAVETTLTKDFADRILPFDGAAARAYGVIVAERRKAGRPIGQADAQIAAVARSRGAVLAARNVPDFEGCGIGVIHPWTSKT